MAWICFGELNDYGEKGMALLRKARLEGDLFPGFVKFERPDSLIQQVRALVFEVH